MSEIEAKLRSVVVEARHGRETRAIAMLTEVVRELYHEVEALKRGNGTLLFNVLSLKKEGGKGI